MCGYWLFACARIHATNWHCYIMARVTDKFLGMLCKFTQLRNKGFCVGSNFFDLIHEWRLLMANHNRKDVDRTKHRNNLLQEKRRSTN